jgi:hypothetical protein
MSNLETQIKQLAHDAATLSRQGVETLPHNQEQGKALMRQAYEASKRCQALMKELQKQPEFDVKKD